MSSIESFDPNDVIETLVAEIQWVVEHDNYRVLNIIQYNIKEPRLSIIALRKQLDEVTKSVRVCDHPAKICWCGVIYALDKATEILNWYNDEPIAEHRCCDCNKILGNCYDPTCYHFDFCDDDNCEEEI